MWRVYESVAYEREHICYAYMNELHTNESTVASSLVRVKYEYVTCHARMKSCACRLCHTHTRTHTHTHTHIWSLARVFCVTHTHSHTHTYEVLRVSPVSQAKYKNFACRTHNFHISIHMFYTHQWSHMTVMCYAHMNEAYISMSTQLCFLGHAWNTNRWYFTHICSLVCHGCVCCVTDEIWWWCVTHIWRSHLWLWCAAHIWMRHVSLGTQSCFLGFGVKCENLICHAHVMPCALRLCVLCHRRNMMVMCYTHMKEAFITHYTVVFSGF